MHGHRMIETALSATRCLLAGASVLIAALFTGPAFAEDDGRPVKIMIINMFGGTPFGLRGIGLHRQSRTE